MAKAMGELLDLGIKLGAIAGDIVTIELPRNMRVIGTCITCQEHSKIASELTCVIRYGFEYEPTKFGCTSWKARKK